MRILVLGGTRHVGRAMVEAGLDADHDVTTVNRGLTRTADPRVTALSADRTVPGQLATAIGDRTFDLVLDTLSGAPRVVRESAALLAERAERYAYVSSRSVHRWPIPPGADESAPVVAADAGGDSESDYPAAKRGGELAVLESFPDRSLLARPGLIIGPYEHIARLPWWLKRLAAGGRVVAPGTPDRPLQYIDARDLASWMITTDAVGPVSAVGAPGFTTMGELLEEGIRITGGRAELVWVDPAILDRHGIRPWVDLPIWLPEKDESSALHDGDHTRALETGLRQRPLTATLKDTWSWILDEGYPARTAEIGLTPELETAVLQEVAASPR